MVKQNSRIGIIGAGTSGVYLAYLLLKQGYQVDIFEKSPTPRTDGCGILLVASGMEALRQGNPDLCYQLIQAGAPVQTFEFRNLKGGIASQERVEYEADEIPGMLIHRKAILEALLSYLPSNCLHLNTAFSHLTQTEEQVTAHFQDGTAWQGDLLIGSDGIYSKVRNFIIPNLELSYLGDIVWRGIVKDDQFCADGLFVVYIRGRGIYTNFFDIGHGYTHWGFFIEKEQEESEYSLPRPHDVGIPPQELAKVPDAARKVIEATPYEDIVCNFSYDLDPIPQLYQGRVLLIGDAAHAKSPTRARGMTSGFEDALALSRYLKESKTVPEALAGFQAERLPIVHEYQRTSREISRKTGRKRKQKTKV
ncbi:MAG: FAD-dependent monooxygenase [Microcystaceae cyanobacterium]